MIAKDLLKMFDDVKSLIQACRNSDKLLNYYTSSYDQTITYSFNDKSRLEINSSGYAVAFKGWNHGVKLKKQLTL
jgi:hypothetical protein